MSVSEATYRQLALEDPEGHWELHCGDLRSKPPMSWDHNLIVSELSHRLYEQFDRRLFQVRADIGHVRRSSQSYYIPDVYVVPSDLVEGHHGDRPLEVYEDPLPLVIEVWSESTGDYDVEVKLVEYQRRGEAEIWLIHPYDHVLRSWVRQADGSYVEQRYSSGGVRPAALADVVVDLDDLFI